MAFAMALSGTIGFFVVESAQSVWNVVFFRCLFGAISLGLYCGYRGFFKPWPFTLKTFGITLACGFALVMNWVLLFAAYQYVPISVATTVYHSQPFFLLMLAAVFMNEKIGLASLPWFLVAFLGLLLITQIKLDDQLLEAGRWPGFLMPLGAAMLYAVATLLTKLLKGIKPHVLAFFQVCLGVLMLVSLAEFTALPELPQQWVYLVILGVVHTCVMYIFLYSSFQKLPMIIIAILAFLYPAVAILVDYLVFDVRLDLSQWLGVILILISATVINLRKT
jgi:drug/metabolite transporter (DMT)-like permease